MFERPRSHLGSTAVIGAALIACVMTMPAHGQTADVQVSTEVVNNNTYVTQTRVVRIRTVASNLGPDNLSSLDVRLFTTTPSANSLDAIVTSPCTTTQGPEGVVNLVWAVGALAVGESRTCELELRARPTAQSALFIFAVEAIIAGFTDPVPGNERPAIDLLSVSPIDIVQDMVLAVRSPTGLLAEPPALLTADITLENRGPDSLLPGRRHLLRSEPYLYGSISSERFLIFSTGDPDCDLFSDDIGGPNGGQRILQINYTNPIPPGTSQTCTLAVAARPDSTGSRSLRWDVGRLTPGLLETNPADNTAFLVMQYSPAVIPADARWALGLLFAGIAVFGLWRLRRVVR